MRADVTAAVETRARKVVTSWRQDTKAKSNEVDLKTRFGFGPVLGLLPSNLGTALGLMTLKDQLTLRRDLRAIAQHNKEIKSNMEITSGNLTAIQTSLQNAHSLSTETQAAVEAREKATQKKIFQDIIEKNMQDQIKKMEDELGARQSALEQAADQQNELQTQLSSSAAASQAQLLQTLREVKQTQADERAAIERLNAARHDTKTMLQDQIHKLEGYLTHAEAQMEKGRQIVREKQAATGERPPNPLIGFITQEGIREQYEKYFEAWKADHN